MCLNARAAAAAQSSDLHIPFMRISITEGSIESPQEAASSHFEYAPMVRHTEKFYAHYCPVQKEETEMWTFICRSR